MPRGGRAAVRAAAAIGFAAAGLYAGYRFFMYSIGYLAANPPHVTAGLMAGLAGFTFVAAAAGVLRDWLVAERLGAAAEETREEAKEQGAEEH